MRKLRIRCLHPQFYLRNGSVVLLLLLAAIFLASPAAAVEFDVKGTKLTVGGYLKAMLIYDSNGTVDSGPFDGDLIGGYDPPLDGTPNADKDDFRMTARESRIFVKTKTDTDMGILKTHVEGDFFGGSDWDSETWSNSTSFRLRHAYGSLAKGSHELTAGQNWSTFMDLAAGVPEMDLAGDPGFTFVRQTLVRYQYNLRPGHYVAAAVENPDRGLTATGPPPTGNLFLNAGDSKETLPDVVLKYFYATKTMTFSTRGLVRQFDLTDAATDEGDTALGWGLGVSGSYKAGPVRLMATFMYGDGVGRYGGLGNIGGAGLTANNDVETVGFMSVNGGVTLDLSDAVKWTVGAGWAENDDEAYTGSDAVLTANATKTAIAYHTNVKWKITPAFEWAIGVGQYEREVMDGREGDMLRTQMYFKWDY